MGENRACDEFMPIDILYNKTNCASCVRWRDNKCREMIWVKEWLQWQ